MSHSVHHPHEIRRLLWDVLPQGQASLTGPEGEPMAGQLFPPTEWGPLPFLRTDASERPRAGATLEITCESRGARYRFYTSLVGFDAAGRLMLTPPSSMTSQDLDHHTEGFHLMLLLGSRMVEQPLVEVAEGELSFRFSAFDLDLRSQQRLYGELALPNGSRSEVELQVHKLEQGEGTGERICVARLVAVSGEGAGWLGVAA
jgi:hypothetical protein